MRQLCIDHAITQMHSMSFLDSQALFGNYILKCFFIFQNKKNMKICLAIKKNGKNIKCDAFK